MSGGLKVGDLYVLLSAKTSAFGKGMEDAAKLTEKIARKIKAAATEIGHAGAMIGGAIAAALAVAAQHNAVVASQVQQTKDIFATFATEIGTMMVPVLSEMNEKLRELLGWWQALSPETKASIANWIEVATTVGLAALALGRVSGLVAVLAPAFQAMGAAVALGLGPLLAVAAVLGAIFFGVAYLHKAWRENWGGIQEKTRSVLEAISSYWQSFKDWLSHSFFDWFIDKWAAIEKALAHAGNFLSNPINSANRDQENKVSDESIDGWAGRMKGGAIGEALRLASEQVEKFAVEGVQEWKLMLADAVSWTKKTLGFTGQQGNVSVHTQTPTVVAAAQRLGEAGEQGRMSDFYEKMDAKDLMRGTGKLGEDGEQGKMTADLAQEYQDEIKVREFFNGQLDQLGRAVTAAISSFASKLGSLGQVINAGIQGFQSGGIWGAIIAVFIELFSKFKRFQELIDIGNGQVMQAITDLSSGFNDLVNGLRPLMGAVGMVAGVIHGILNPILHIIGKAFEQLAPVLGLISTILQPITWLFEFIGGLFDGLSQVLAPFTKILDYVMRFIGLTILGTMNGLLGLWTGILDMVREIVHAVGGNTTDLDRLRKEAVEKQNGIQQQMRNLAEKGYSQLANESANTAEKIGKLGDMADKVSEQLTNIPQGFKVALAQFGSTTATGSYNDAERNAFLQTGSPTKSTGWTDSPYSGDTGWGGTT